jgi:hypothetical protein
MSVHFMCTQQQLLKVLVANDETDGETDSGPKRVTSTNPIPEFEHVGFGDTEAGHGFGVGRQGDKVFSNVGFLAGVRGGLVWFVSYI